VTITKNHPNTWLWPSLALSAVMMAAGLIWKQHWLLGCANITSNLGFMSTVLFWRKEHASIVRGFSLSRAPSSLARSTKSWTPPYAFAVAALSASIVLHAIEIWVRGKQVWLLWAPQILLVAAGSLAMLPILRAWIALRSGQTSVALTRPPRSAKFILLLIPKRHREHLIGDLEEEYSTILVPEYGPRKARLW
jgi:hypothetical protein